MKLREIVLDTETTGLDPLSGHRIVEIGALELSNRIMTGRKFHFYINPMRDMPAEAYRIHGISGEFLKDKPLFSSIVDEFLEFIDGGKLIIHNAPFDIKFLNYELSLVNRPTLTLDEVTDTLAMARKMFPGAKTNLDALCKRFKIDNSARQLHGALKDAALLAQVYVELMGGRQSTFTLSSGEKKAKQYSKTQITSSGGSGSINTNAKSTPIIKATKEELKKHKEFLARFSGTA